MIVEHKDSEVVGSSDDIARSSLGLWNVNGERERYKDRLRFPTHKVRGYEKVDVYSVEDLDSLVSLVKSKTEEGYSFTRLLGDYDGELTAEFERDVPWTPEEIKEAEDYLRGHPEPESTSPITITYRRTVPFEVNPILVEGEPVPVGHYMHSGGGWVGIVEEHKENNE